MADRHDPVELDAQLQALDAGLVQCFRPTAADERVADRIFEQSRSHLGRQPARTALRIVEDDGPSMLPRRSTSAWPVLGAMAAMVLIGSIITLRYGTQWMHNNPSPVQSGQSTAQAESQGYDSHIDTEFESAFAVESSALLSDIHASVDALMEMNDDWSLGNLSMSLQAATADLWEDMNSF